MEEGLGENKIRGKTSYEVVAVVQAGDETEPGLVQGMERKAVESPVRLMGGLRCHNPCFLISNPFPWFYYQQK